MNITYNGFEPDVLNINTEDTIVWKNLRGERSQKTAFKRTTSLCTTQQTKGFHHHNRRSTRKKNRDATRIKCR